MLLNLTALRLWLAAGLLFLSSFAIAQQKTVSGRVTDAKNEPLVGASVTVKGTNTGTTTDESGRFTLSVPNDQAVLIVSYVGLDTKDVTVKGVTNMDVSLGSTGSTLNEVVVTGYSSQARKDITGSVSVVKVEDLKSVPSSNAESQLQGRASGVTVTSTGVPGASPTVKIRGFSNFGANSPLYVVDGVPTGDLRGLNPNDIESMQVLKDAASASIYGSRAAQGVIIVTTKRGRQGLAKVSYNSYYGQQDPGKGFTNLLNPQEQAELLFLAYQNSPGQTRPTNQYGTGSKPILPDYILAGSTGGLFEGDPRVDPAKYRLNIDDPGSAYLIVKANKEGTNYFDEITNRAPIMNHNLAVSGGANKSRYLFSLDFFDQKGILIHNFYKRYTSRINSEFSIKNNIRLGENLQVSYTEDNTPGNNNEGTEIAFSYRNQAIIPVYDIMGNFAGTRGPGLGNGQNPVASRIRAKDNRGQNMALFGNIYAEVDFLRHLTARSSFGGQMNSGNYYFFTNRTYERSENNSGNSYREGFNRFRSWTWTNQLTYKNVFNSVHDITAVAGTEAIEEFGRSIEGGRSDYFLENEDFRSLNNGSSGQIATGGPFTPASLFSIFGKVDYTFNEKYLASVTVRRDGSSRFGPENRYGTFPAFSLGWRISKERFMEGLDFISDLKLRGSYGIMGGQRINPGNAFTQFNQGIGSSYYDINGTSTGAAAGFQSSFIGNLAGKWEENITTDIGFDASLFGGKTELVFDWYNKATNDLLYQRRGVATGGLAFAAARTFYNTASMVNKGVDIMLSQKAGVGTGTNRVKLDLTGTFTTYKNEITKLADGNTFYETGGSRIGNFVRNAIGQPVGSFFGYQVTGLFQDTVDVARSPKQEGAGVGRFKYQDTNNDGKISDSDRVYFGDPNPDFTYGFNVNAGFKAFDVSVFFYGSKGAEAINYVRYFTDFYPSFAGAKSEDLLYNSFSATNKGAKTPIAENVSNFSNNRVVNSYYLEKASYLRLKNLTVGYNLSPKLLNRIRMDRLRLYVQGTNLFTKTKYTGLDPEIIGGQDNFGIDAGAYPTVRQFLFGLNVNF